MQKTIVSVKLWITLENINTILWIQFDTLFKCVICDHVCICMGFFYHISVTISEYRPMCVYISFRFTSIRIYNVFYKFETSILEIKSYFYWKVLSRSRKWYTFCIIKHAEAKFFFLLERIGEVDSISQFPSICPVHSVFLHYILRKK